MRQVRILLLAGSLGLLAFAPLQAQTFHEIYGRPRQVGALTSVASTRAPGAIASGLFDSGPSQSVLLKVQPAGALDWVRTYGPLDISAVREAPGGGYAWIGTGEDATAKGSAPVVTLVDPLGTVVWARKLRLVRPDGTPADQAYGRFLEPDLKDGGFWVGGDLWYRTADDPQPWLGKLDRTGTLVWAKTLGFAANARFFSIFPALGGGIIGVGQIWAQDAPNLDQATMLAVRLDALGDVRWAFRYSAWNDGRGEQRLMDLDRDPRYTWKESVVVGTVNGFCRTIPSIPCDRLESAAFVASLDEETGRMWNGHGLYSTSRPKTLGETIVMDLPNESVAVGGEVVGTGPGSSQGLLAILFSGFSFVRMSSLHGTPGLDAEVRSLDLWREGNGFGYLFLMNETSPGTPPSWLRSLVRTDRDGHTGSCEQCTEAKTFEAWNDQLEVQLNLYEGKAEQFPVTAAPFELPAEPCGLRPCAGR